MVKCRNCDGTRLNAFLDLGTSPLSNAYIKQEDLAKPETWYPLRVLICEDCWLAQTEDFISGPDVFTPRYAYFSSTSDSWLVHSEKYAETVIKRFDLDEGSRVIEVASNDGYLLQFFSKAGIPCLGVEPTHDTAQSAKSRGIETLEVFLSTDTVNDVIEIGGLADLVIANNVMAHVPNIADFARALSLLLKPNGVLTVEFPTITMLINEGFFDTVYHEHFSYLSLHSIIEVLQRASLEVFDVEQLTTHGGSLRVYAQRIDSGSHNLQGSVQKHLAHEKAAGVLTLSYYSRLQSAAVVIKSNLLRFLLRIQESNLSIAGYGAAAKGNTLLNFAGVKADLLPYVVDRSPGKVGKYLPGSRIPILSVSELLERRPDNILVIPWNLVEEVTTQLRNDGLGDSALWRALPRLEEIAISTLQGK